MLSFRFVSTWADIFRLERRNSSNVPIIKEGAKQVQSKLRLSAIVSFSRCSNSPSVQTVVGLPKSFHITHFSCNGKYLISLNSCSGHNTQCCARRLVKATCVQVIIILNNSHNCSKYVPYIFIL